MQYARISPCFILPPNTDQWPQRFGVLRSDGTAERALFVIDKTGIIRFISVSDINRRPNLKEIVDALKAIDTP